MKCGIPVAASNCSGILEVVGDAAALFDPADIRSMADAMITILTDTAVRNNLVEKGLRRAAMFSWEKAAWLTLQVYEEAAGL